MAIVEVTGGNGGSIAVDANGATIGFAPTANILTSPTYGQAVQFGNVHGSFGGAGTGSPADSYMPVVIYEKFGTNGGAAVTKTTQALRTLAVYASQTADDSAEANSSQVILGDNAAASFTQSVGNTTGHEGSAQTRGTVHATSLVVGTAGRIIASETSTIDNAIAVYAAFTKDAGATITSLIAFGDNGVSGFTFGVHVQADIFTAGNILCSGFNTNNALYGDIPLAAALGFKTWNVDPVNASTGTAPTAGTVYAVGVPYRQGQVVSKTIWYTNVAGNGTAPTHIYTGICDASGKMLAQSNDDAANSGWTGASHLVSSALNGSWTVPASGLYYHVFLQVGAWGTTQMTMNRATGLPATVAGVLGQATGGTTAQTGLPANNSTIAGGLVSTNSLRYFSGG